MEIPEKYKKILSEHSDLNDKLQDQTIFKNPKLLEATSKKFNFLSPIALMISEFEKLSQELIEAKNIIETEKDQEIIDMAVMEKEDLETKIVQLQDSIEEKIKISDPNDARNSIMEIRAGTGGEEAALFAGDLFRMYRRYAETKGWKIEILNTNTTGNGGYKEIVMMISGDNIYGQLKHESGVHRVQRIPSTESSGRIHTSASSVVVLPEVDDIDIEIDQSDLKIDVYRSSGPGGQSVNTTDSAVRITHLPSGIVITCQDEKSQLKNKARAMSILKSKLFEIEEERKMKEASDARKSSIGSGDRSAKIRTYNFPDSRITDHRIKKTWYNLQGILDGDLDEVIQEVSRGLHKEEE